MQDASLRNCARFVTTTFWGPTAGRPETLPSTSTKTDWRSPSWIQSGKFTRTELSEVRTSYAWLVEEIWNSSLQIDDVIRWEEKKKEEKKRYLNKKKKTLPPQHWDTWSLSISIVLESIAANVGSRVWSIVKLVATDWVRSISGPRNRATINTGAIVVALVGRWVAHVASLSNKDTVL